MMFRRFMWLGGCAFAGVVLFSGCGNAVPTVDAGPDAPAAVGRNFTFSPTASDEDGDALTYAWVVTSTPASSNAKLSGADTGRASFTPDVPGVYGFSVSVSDGMDTSSPDTIEITARPPPKIGLNAVAIDMMGSQRTLSVDAKKPVVAITPDERIELDAESSTVSTGMRDFQWAVEPPKDVKYALGGGTTSTLTFTVDNATPDASKPSVTVRGTYRVTLNVGDDGREEKGVLKDFTTSKVVTTHVRLRPVAQISATPDTSVVAPGTEVTLDGSKSEVGAGGVATYTWNMTAPTGSMAMLSNTMSRSATTTVTLDVVGRYTFELRVNDGAFDSDPASVRISARAP